LRLCGSTALRCSTVLTARCAQDAKHAKKDIVTAGYRRSQLICTHFIARQGMVLFLIVRSDQEINKTLSVFASLRFTQFNSEGQHSVFNRGSAFP